MSFESIDNVLDEDILINEKTQINFNKFIYAVFDNVVMFWYDIYIYKVYFIGKEDIFFF